MQCELCSTPPVLAAPSVFPSRVCFQRSVITGGVEQTHVTLLLLSVRSQGGVRWRARSAGPPEPEKTPSPRTSTSQEAQRALGSGGRARVAVIRSGLNEDKQTRASCRTAAC